MIHKKLEEFLANNGFQRYESGEPYGEIYIKDDCVIFVNFIDGAHPDTIRNIKGRHDRLIFIKKKRQEMAGKTIMQKIQIG